MCSNLWEKWKAKSFRKTHSNIWKANSNELGKVSTDVWNLISVMLISKDRDGLIMNKFKNRVLQLCLYNFVQFSLYSFQGHVFFYYIYTSLCTEDHLVH